MSRLYPGANLIVFIVAVPLGKIADKVGRKKALMSSIFGSLAGVFWILFVCLSHNLRSDLTELV